jgi:serine/threonine-protein kinase
MDFGVARLAAGTTAAGTMVGTPNYMSPEQVRTGLVDGRSDLFSAGLILYELVTGEKVYRADNVVSILYKIAHEDPALAELPKGPQWERLRSVVVRALARQPDDRYPDARSMSDDVTRALEDFGGPATGPAAWDETVLVEKSRDAEEPAAALPEPRMRPAARVAPPTPRAEPSRGLAFAALGAALVALIVGAGLFVWLRPAPTPQPTASPVVDAAASAAPLSPPSTVPAAPPSLSPSAPFASPPASRASAGPSPRPVPERSLPAAESVEAEPRPGAEAARLEKANDLFDRGRYAAALAEAKAVLRRSPGNAEARSLAEDAEVAIVVEGHLKKARDALRKGDREAALQEARAGLAVAPSDARLLALFKEATR